MRGEIPQVERPEGLDASFDAMLDHVYGRRNVAGAHEELWYHAAGCRAWLVVTRDTRTHEVMAVDVARERCSRGVTQ